MFLVLLAASLIFQSCENSKPETSDNTQRDTIRESGFFKKYSINEQREDLKKTICLASP
jgi:hypothetical protein